MSPKKIGRRKFLKQSSALAGITLLDWPISALIDTILQGAVSRAIAESGSVAPRKWVDLRLRGAPPRWVFDLVLKTGAADDTTFVPPPPGGSLATRFVASGGRYTSAIYSTTTIGGLRLPHLWQFSVPTPTGTRPMADLLPGFLCIRGIHTGNPAHTGAESLHFRPQGSLQSLPALAGDASNAPIPAIDTTVSEYTYTSKVGRSSLALGGDLITSLLSPFKASNATLTLKQKETALQSFIDRSRALLSSKQIADHPDAAKIKQSVVSAEAMMRKSLTGMEAQFAALVTKYSGLIQASLATRIPGINDLPIGTSSGARSAHYQAVSRIVTTPDLRTLIDPSRASLPSAIGTMARAFALVEFVLINGFSDSITASIGGISNIRDGSTAVDYSFDEHFTGVMVSTYYNTMHSVAQAACLLELIDRLKSARIWTETVINIGSEFNRSPKGNGSGSDHGYQGASVQIYSGCIPGPLILGNIAADPLPQTYKGTWGYGAEQPQFDSYLELGHAINTVASLLRVPQPVAARPPLLDGSGTMAVATVPQGKIIA